MAYFARLALPDERGFCGASPESVTVDAVVAQIQLAADEPPGPGQVPLKNLVPGLEPVEIAGRIGPEFFGILNRLLVERLVFFEALDVGPGAELRGRRKDTVFAQRGVDIAVGDGNRQGRHAGSFKESSLCTDCDARGWRPRRKSLGVKLYRAGVGERQVGRSAGRPGASEVRASHVAHPFALCFNEGVNNPPIRLT